MVEKGKEKEKRLLVGESCKRERKIKREGMRNDTCATVCCPDVRCFVTITYPCGFTWPYIGTLASPSS